MSALGRNAMHLQAARLIQAICAFGASIVLARATGPAGLGEYAVLLAIVVLVQGLTSLGFEDLVLARGPRAGGASRAAMMLYARTLSLRILAALALLVLGALIASGIIPNPLPGTSALALGCALGYAGLNSIATLGATIQASRIRAGASAAVDVCWAVSVVGAYGVLLQFGALTVDNALVVIFLAQLIANVGYFIMLRDVSPGRSGSKPNLLRPREAVMFWLNGLLSIGVGKNSDVLAMKGAGAASTPIGLYGAAFNANQTASQVLTQGAGTMFYVGLGSVYGRGIRDDIAAAWRVVVVANLLLTAPIFVYCLVFPQAVIYITYGGAYDGAASALAWLALFSLFIRGVGGGANQGLLFLAERQAQVLQVRGGVVLLNIVLDVVGYKTLGIVGVALASGFCGLLITVIEFALCRRHVPVRLPVATYMRMVGPYLITCGLARVLVPTDAGELVIALAGGVAFAAATGLLVLTKPLRRADLPNAVPARLRHVLIRYLVLTAPYQPRQSGPGLN